MSFSLYHLSIRKSDVYFINASYFSQKDLEEIQAEEARGGNYKAARKLLFILPCRKQNWFVDLVAALRNTGHIPLVKLIEPDFLRSGWCNYFLTSFLYCVSCVMLCMNQHLQSYIHRQLLYQSSYN